jgi:membrane protein DedA with SNARE-associated domain
VDLWELFPFTPEVGYLGLAIVSFFGSLIPFVPIPSFVLVATMAVGEQFDIHILVIIAALTSTAAKQIIFYISYGGRKIISEKTKKRMKPFQKLVKRYGGSAAFVAAATPIPDDLVYIPLGLAKYNPKRFFVATLLGKIVLYYVIVLISHYMGLSLLEPILENIEDPLPVYIGIIILGLAMTITVILLLRLNWERILSRVAPWTLEDDDDNQN